MRKWHEMKRRKLLGREEENREDGSHTEREGGKERREARESRGEREGVRERRGEREGVREKGQNRDRETGIGGEREGERGRKGVRDERKERIEREGPYNKTRLVNVNIKSDANCAR